MKKNLVLIASFMFLVLISSLTAFAQVPPVMTSPTLGANGFPSYIEDSVGLQLGLCDVDNGADALGNALGPCLLDVGLTNYWAADAIVESADLNERYLMAMSISAIVEPGIKQLANDVVIRLRNKNGLKVGNYTVVTPYKNYTLTATAGQKDIRVVDGLETIIEGVGAVPGPIFPPAIPIDGPIFGNLLTTRNDTVNPPPAGFVGTGKEAIFSTLDAPGPNGGVFRVTDPDGIVVAETDQFSVQGKLLATAPGGVTTDTVTIRSTTFNARRRILTIRVASSQTTRPRPTFTATANGVSLPVSRAGVVTAAGLPAGLTSITVISSAGGTATITVPIP